MADETPSTIVAQADDLETPGALHHLGPYIDWRPGDPAATLDGRFTADDLEAIAQHMRTHGHG